VAKQKISGTYLDKNKFKYVIYYDGITKQWRELIYNPEDKFCSSSLYKKETILDEISIMEKIA